MCKQAFWSISYKKEYLIFHEYSTIYVLCTVLYNMWLMRYVMIIYLTELLHGPGEKKRIAIVCALKISQALHSIQLLTDALHIFNNLSLQILLK